MVAGILVRKNRRSLKLLYHKSKTKTLRQIDGQRKTFFATPFFWKFVLDGEIRGANETKYVDIFTCSRMLIPVNIKLKHWILACIDFEQKWIAWLDSIDDTHEQETRLLFDGLQKNTPLTNILSLNRLNGPFILARHPICKSHYSPTTVTAAYSYASTHLILTYAYHSPSPNMIHGTYVRGWLTRW